MNTILVVCVCNTFIEFINSVQKALKDLSF